MSGCYSGVVVGGLLIAVVSLVAALRLMALVSPQHVESSRTRDQTHIPCIGRWALNHWTISEVPGRVLDINTSSWHNEFQKFTTL